MTEVMTKLAEAMDAAFKFKVGDTVEGKVVATVTAPADDRLWVGEMTRSNIRLAISERIASQCEQGVQPFYRCSAWFRNGARATETMLIPECELRLSEPFELPGSTEPEHGTMVVDLPGLPPLRAATLIAGLRRIADEHDNLGGLTNAAFACQVLHRGGVTIEEHK